jgi:hypothetical protein
MVGFETHPVFPRLWDGWKMLEAGREQPTLEICFGN